ncbi:hypothetical protein E2C01_003353 [Portunus trituberculatus]|uniref:Uncharacterized protein n=1 Tax=Portunus trituberculatus TaxID=210409 RepID=A0A5B7CTB7_PORTR|nr:hypothetical protein [Portunus trituberculatus]
MRPQPTRHYPGDDVSDGHRQTSHVGPRKDVTLHALHEEYLTGEVNPSHWARLRQVSLGGCEGGWAHGVTAQLSPSGTHGRATFVSATHPSGRDTFHL